MKGLTLLLWLSCCPQMGRHTPCTTPETLELTRPMLTHQAMAARLWCLTLPALYVPLL
jgi:hypothetical protein